MKLLPVRRLQKAERDLELGEEEEDAFLESVLCQGRGHVISRNGIIRFLLLNQLGHTLLCEESKGICTPEHLRDHA